MAAATDGPKREVLDTIAASADVAIPRNYLQREELIEVAHALGVPGADELSITELRGNILLRVGLLTPSYDHLTPAGIERRFRLKELAAVSNALIEE